MITKNYDNEFVVKQVEEIVHEACKQDTNIHGYGAWTHHITSVVEYAKALSEKLNADTEIVELAALLHDYSSVKTPDGYEQHHIKGANYAQEILTTFNYPQDKIDKIKHCIIAHRGSKDIPRETIEAEIIASADAMAHFNNVDSLLYLTYVNKQMNIDEGLKYVLDKLERSYNKLIPEAKEIINSKYEAIKIAFNK